MEEREYVIGGLAFFSFIIALLIIYINYSFLFLFVLLGLDSKWRRFTDCGPEWLPVPKHFDALDEL
jgi:hypothetical protein